MANGNLTKKEPKIVENDHKSLKKSKNYQKGLKIVKNGQKNPTNLDFKKTGKNTSNMKFMIWAWLYHATPSCGNIYNY